jgi:hypothetical protein
MNQKRSAAAQRKTPPPPPPTAAPAPPAPAQVPTHYVLTADNFTKLVELLRQAPFFIAQPCFQILDQSTTASQRPMPANPGKIVDNPLAPGDDAGVPS